MSKAAKSTTPQELIERLRPLADEVELEANVQLNSWLGDVGAALAEAADMLEAAIRVMEHARKMSIALTDLSGGGSEMFTRVGDEFYADPELCKRRTQEKIDMAWRSWKAGIMEGKT